VQSSAPVELTEAETEYAVNVVKHIYDGHVVLQFDCSNTIPEQLLENVSITPPPLPHLNEFG
jgi:coatomer subunit gamma